MEIEIDYLKQMQQDSPLPSYWLKKDYITDVEAVFIYYNIEPLDILNLGGPVENYLSLFDKEYLWEVLKGSDLLHITVFRKGICLPKFVEFLFEKEFDIPPHLQPLCKSFFKSDLANSMTAPAMSMLNEVTGKSSLSEVVLIDENSPENGDQDMILNYNLNKFRVVQVQKLHARTFAAYYWKKSKNKLSANALVTQPIFLDAMKSVGAEEVSPKTLAIWISNLGPRAKKK